MKEINKSVPFNQNKDIKSIDLPDDSPQQSRASFIMEGDDNAGGRQV